MIHGTKRWIGVCAVVALIATGCHKPTFDQLQSSTVKWSVAVVAQAESQAQQAEVQKLSEDAAKVHAMTSQVAWVAPEDVSKTAARYADNGTDLVLLTNGADLGDLPKKNVRTRFAVLGDASQPNSINVRHLVPDQKQFYFLAGYLAAEANKDSAEPFSVLVAKSLPADDQRWKMIVAGAHYAGRKDVPAQVIASELDATEKPATDSTKRAAAPVVNPPVVKGRSLILLTDLSDQAWAKIRTKNIHLIRTDSRTSPLAQQANVLAQPKSLLAEALKEETELLQSGKWQGQQVATLSAKHLYAVVNPQRLRDQGLASRLELIEDSLTVGSIKPDDYVGPILKNGQKATR